MANGLARRAPDSCYFYGAYGIRSLQREGGRASRRIQRRPRCDGVALASSTVRGHIHIRHTERCQNGLRSMHGGATSACGRNIFWRRDMLSNPRYGSRALRRAVWVIPRRAMLRVAVGKFAKLPPAGGTRSQDIELKLREPAVGKRRPSGLGGGALADDTTAESLVLLFFFSLFITAKLPNCPCPF